jgi:hypothetical protein
VPSAPQLHPPQLGGYAFGFAINHAREQVTRKLLAAGAALLGNAIEPVGKVVWNLN